MAKILERKNGVFAAGTFRPVEAVGGGVFLSADGAALAFGITVQDVLQSANTGIQAITRLGTVQFRWPDLKTVCNTWPTWPVVESGQSLAKPCDVHFKTPGRRGRRYVLHFGSVTAVVNYLGIPRKQVVSILDKTGGQAYLPQCVTDITYSTTNQKNLSSKRTRKGKYFYLTLTPARKIKVTPVGKQFVAFDHLADVPDFAIRHGEWV